MNKKIIKILSIVLSFIMLFGTALTVGAEGETPAPTEKVTVRIRVEGLSKNLTEKVLTFDKNITLKDLILNANLNAVISDDGKSINSVMLEGASTLGSVWGYAVDGVIGKETVDNYIVTKDINLVLYNATPDAVMPEVKYDEVETTGVVEFIGTDKDGNKAPIANASIIWNGEARAEKTDSDGKIYLGKDEIKKGDYSVQISCVNENNIPKVVRFDKNAEVEIDDVKDKDSSDKNIFERAYDFLYSILKGVIEVWAFYIKALIGLFS